MPREESIAESAKQRSLRVPLDHYEQPDALVRAKWKLSAVVAVVAAVYLVWLLIGGRTAQQQTSPGRLAAAHASWNDDCLACHKSFQPLRSDALSLAGLLQGGEAWRQSLDEGCIKCHNTPVHHAAAKADEVPSCAACHRDHQGSSADIVRAADANCLGCHRDIDVHRSGKSGLSPAVANIRGFGTGDRRQQTGDRPHPDFRSLENDPGNIKFNHWLHMQPGVAVADAKQKLKLDDLEASWRSHYAAYAKADGLVQLDCGACHQADSAGGAYMQPIAFEQHCRACHRLELKNGSAVAEVPHGLSAERLTAVVGGLLLGVEQTKNDLSATADESGQRPLIPGRTLGQNLAQKVTQDVLGQRASASRQVMAKCLECHYARESNQTTHADVPDVLAADVPGMWLRHGRFDHRAHRHVECRNCHAAAYAYEQHDKPQFVSPREGATAARDDQMVMIAGLENCAVCHAPARGSAGGARHDCAECHRYHGGDSSLRGQGVGVRSQESGNREQGTGDRGQGRQRIRLASLAPSAPEYVGAWSCASAGCHGDVRGGGPEWKSAFTVWATVDPHAQAFDVLWTFRGREMTRLLEGKEKGTGDRRQETDAIGHLTDVEHFDVLQRRCVGCHATPGPHSGRWAEPTLLGVSCESCHGAAGAWLHAHYRAKFDRHTPGFIDTREDLKQRASTCMKCHVGPSDEAGAPQVVDHDLIAAGHPRLAFEFHSYYESKPAHWNRKAIEGLQPGDFHFRSWVAGQVTEAEQRKRLAPEAGVADFSQLDCTSCHHALAADSWRQKSQAAVLQIPAWPGMKLPAVAEPLPVAARLQLANEIMQTVERGGSWDEGVQCVLALRAILDDLNTGNNAPLEVTSLRTAVALLSNYLASDCFSSVIRENRQPTPYDSPTDFSPSPFNERLAAVRAALQQLETKASAP